MTTDPFSDTRGSGAIRLGAVWVAAALLTTSCASPGGSPSPVSFDADRIEADIHWLADDAREGRGVGSESLEEAARYIASGFGAAGLAPGGDEGTFLAHFEMPISAEIAEATLENPGTAFVRGTDFDAFLISDDGNIEAEAVFAGYGISVPEQGYDDYAGLDVEGKIVLVLSDRPSGDASPLAQEKSPALLRRTYKFTNAQKHGAAAVILVPSIEDAEGLAGNAGQESSNPTTQAGGIVALGASRSLADRIVSSRGGASLGARQARIEAHGRPASEALGVTLRVRVRGDRRTGRVANVIGVVEGSDPELRNEVVVVGAHYDHLGHGRFGSLTPDRRGEVHNGADDNASGTAGLLGLARAFGREAPARRTLVIVAFTGEEAGLVGSAEYVRDPLYPMGDTVAMVNLDMIGRLRDGELVVFGIETSPDFSEIVERAAQGVPLTPKLTDGGYSASDQTSFYARDVPVLFFFTGAHSEYHTPDDDVAHVNAAGEADVLSVVYGTVRGLLDRPKRPEVVTAAAPSRTGGGGYGPYLGTIPDFGGSAGDGVLLQGVRDGSPAQRAGLRAGDRLVGFDGASVANLEEYAALLYSSRPGQRVEVIVVRDGRREVLEAVLGQRR